MNKLQINPSKLNGIVEVAGAKNSALKLLAASILTKDKVILRNYPSKLLDTSIHVDMLRMLGKDILHKTDEEIHIKENGNLSNTLKWDGMSIRNTLLILGSLVTRTGYGRVPLPGGCKLGDRKYDLHIYALEKLGAKIWEENGFLCAESTKKRMQGAEIDLPIRSTGATENSILISSLAEGTTRIWNPHIRPEILDLIDMLKKMGAKIEVFGQQHIEVTGVDELNGVEHHVIPDNMEAITWLVAASITKGDVEIRNFPYGDLEVVLSHLKSAGAKIYKSENSAIVRGSNCYPLEISTGPHPGINSDVQPILAAWASACLGESRIVDLRFPGRYGYAVEMAKMGLNYRIQGDMLIIKGSQKKLRGAEVNALDLRAGIALALCGLTADGPTTIKDAWQISRGYVDFETKLRSLGATAEWIN